MEEREKGDGRERRGIRVLSGLETSLFLTLSDPKFIQRTRKLPGIQPVSHLLMQAHALGRSHPPTHPPTHTRTHTHTHTHTHTLTQAEILGALKRALVDVRPASFDDCIKWARELFQEHFHNTIEQLLFNFPADHVSHEYSLV